jgi:hypothetical protein
MCPRTETPARGTVGKASAARPAPGLKLNELGQLRVETTLKADACVCDPELGRFSPGDMKL